jgi:hypothetical protein
MKMQEPLRADRKMQKKLLRDKNRSNRPAHCISRFPSSRINISVVIFIWNELLRTYLCDRFLKRTEGQKRKIGSL